MNKRLLFALAITTLSLGACNQGLDRTGSSPNPLMELPEERRWIILQAGHKIPPYCGQYYDAPTDPRYKGHKEKCEIWELNTIDYLAENKLTGVEPEHLREVQFWDWQKSFANKIQECRKQYMGGNTRQEIDKNIDQRQKCDPFNEAKKKGAEALGLTKINGGFKLPKL